jgi:Ni,Fe-hydrogenase III small subunit
MMWPVIRQISKVGIGTEKPPVAQDLAGVGRIHDEILKILGRALTIREVDAGSCNGCELELNALGNLYYNLEGLGIKFVASPRHADMLLVTGPVSRNMSHALAMTDEAMPAPKIVVAVGDCAINGGIFGESYASLGGVSKVLTVDLAIPGCPPEPIVILEGILTAVRYRLKPRSGEK